MRILPEFINSVYNFINQRTYASYLFFLLYVFVYNYFYLHQGIAIHLDEGYLLSLGQRICDGQVPYIDFYFLRTPLSIYLQTLFITVFGDSYTMYLSRMLYVLQLTVLTVCISDLYRKHINNIELVMLLVISYTTSTLLLQFQWYSYDGLFFAGVSLFLLHRKQFILTGLAAFLAGMSKQNYLLLLPMILIISSLSLTFDWKKLKEKNIIPIRILIGFITPTAITVIYFFYLGNLKEFINQSFFLPKVISGISTQFAFLQNNPEVFVQSAVSVIVISVLYNFNKNRILSFIISVVLISSIASQFFIDVEFFIFNIIFINYTIAVLYFLNYKENKFKDFYKYFVPIIFIQYLSGLNYSGILFAYMGAGIVLPFSYIILKRNKSLCYITLFVFVSIGFVGVKHKYNYMYQDVHRKMSNATFNLEKLNYINSDEKQTAKINKISKIINDYSEPNDFIFMYPNNASVYYLTDRKNPTKIDWYYKLEFNHEMFLESIDALNENKPKIIFIDVSPPPLELAEFLENNYSPYDTIDNLFVYLPKQTSEKDLIQFKISDD